MHIRRLVLFIAALWLVSSAGRVAAQTPPALGFHVARGDAAHMEAARAAGAQFVVVVFSWRDIEPTPNVHYWETPDAALRAAEYHGLDVVARLDRPPAWAESAEGPAPWAPEAYAAFAGQVAARYGDRLAGVILWNEPNLALEWAGRRPDPAGYLALLQAAYPAVKAAAPELPVLLAGLAFTLGDGDRAIDDREYLGELYRLGAGAYFDILAAHPYGFGRPPGEAPAADRLNFRRLELHRALMVAAGDAEKPVWVTEMGWRTSAPDPADGWQVVTPATQRDDTLQALALGAGYPWLARMALWELNAGEDQYGYALWRGDTARSSTYAALLARCGAQNAACAPPVRAQHTVSGAITILAPDVTIRLGDRGELHPHWVHLHRGGEYFTPAWEGEFFVAPTAVAGAFDLVLETMQVDQPTNRVAIDGQEIGLLAARSRPDPTSSWQTQRLPVPAGLLRPGANTLRIDSGPRNPARQYSWWRWENFQVRNVRLEPGGEAEETRSRGAAAWRLRGAPGGWSETNRLRMLPAEAGGALLWVTGNRPGEVWRMQAAGEEGAARMVNEATAETGAIFLDIASDGVEEVAATDRGLLQRRAAGEWQPAQGAPAAIAHVALHHGGRWFAGFEGAGLWAADTPRGPWRPAGLAGRTVLDLAAAGSQFYAATERGVYRRTAAGAWRGLPPLPPDEEGAQAAAFVPRLWGGAGGEVVVRSQDRLFRWDEWAAVWAPFGPEALQGSLYSVARCCAAGALAGTKLGGLWELSPEGAWMRVDGGYFDDLELTGLAASDGALFVGTTNGLFALPQATPGAAAPGWRSVAGLPATITDLLTDPEQPTRLLAGTPVGIFRSEDSGTTWSAISPPWMVWDLAWGADGRVWVARMDGIAWTMDAGADAVAWEVAGGMRSVTFFAVSPDPGDGQVLWAGSWGNDIGVSTDGGATLQPLHNGLETLSVLAILRHATPGQFTAGTAEGLNRSDDGGANWFPLPGPLARQTVYALHQDATGALWAGAADGLWVSRDYGVSWAQVTALSAATVLRIGVLAGANREILWAGTEGAGLWASADGGTTWRAAGLPGRTVYQVVADPLHPGGWLAATDQGLFAGR